MAGNDSTTDDATDDEQTGPTPLADVDPNPDGAHGDVAAFTPTPTDAIIRLRGHETSDGWLQTVEVVAPDGETVTALYEGTGAIKPCAVYNQTMDIYARMHPECESITEEDF